MTRMKHGFHHSTNSHTTEHNTTQHNTTEQNTYLATTNTTSSTSIRISISNSWI